MKPTDVAAQAVQAFHKQLMHQPLPSPTPLNPLYEVEESLKSALPWLENAYALMNSNGLDKSHRQLYTAVCDAMTAAQEGCSRAYDAPDEI